MKKILLTSSLLFFVIITSISASYYTKGTGDWETNAIWGTNTTTGAGVMWSTLTLVAGDKIYIDDNITLNTILSIGVDVTIYLNSNLTVDGQLTLTTNSTIVFQSSSAKVIGTPPGNSDKIKIGPGNTVWTTSNGTITGPGTLDKNSTNGVLPIELLYFKAKIQEDNVILTWASATEMNFNYFEVERSSNGKDFTSIGKVIGNGTSKVRHDYALQDVNPLIGKNYYRLKSVDFDLYTEYFPLIMVDFYMKKIFHIAPNPSDGTSFGIAINFIPDENSSIIIYNNLSKILDVFTPSKDLQKFTFSTDLHSGVYFAKFISNDFVKVERFIVN